MVGKSWQGHDRHVSQTLVMFTHALEQTAFDDSCCTRLLPCKGEQERSQQGKQCHSRSFQEQSSSCPCVYLCTCSNTYQSLYCHYCYDLLLLLSFCTGGVASGARAVGNAGEPGSSPQGKGSSIVCPAHPDPLGPAASRISTQAVTPGMLTYAAPKCATSDTIWLCSSPGGRKIYCCSDVWLAFCKMAM